MCRGTLDPALRCGSSPPRGVHDAGGPRSPLHSSAATVEQACHDRGAPAHRTMPPSKRHRIRVPMSTLPPDAPLHLLVAPDHSIASPHPDALACVRGRSCYRVFLLLLVTTLYAHDPRTARCHPRSSGGLAVPLPCVPISGTGCLFCRLADATSPAQRVKKVSS
jgi:hypothetical protein